MHLLNGLFFKRQELSAMFFLEQLFIKIFVNSDRESRSSSDDSSRDDKADHHSRSYSDS